jgi:hypothetical protein
MSASSSITRTEMFPLRMQQCTVLGTGRHLVVPGRGRSLRRHAEVRRRATIAASRVTAIDGGPYGSGVPLLLFSSRRSPAGVLRPLTGTPVLVAPLRATCIRLRWLFSSRRPSWRRHGAGTALSGCRSVARRKCLGKFARTGSRRSYARREAPGPIPVQSGFEVGNIRPSGSSRGETWRAPGQALAQVLGGPEQVLAGPEQDLAAPEQDWARPQRIRGGSRADREQVDPG